MYNKKVSIIVPVFNVEKYLERCVKSLLNQTYQNIEIILIDDGSTDKSGEILDQYAAKDHRIEVYHIQNSGVSTARNVGLKYALGEFITFVDSDDTVSLDMYDVLIDQFLKKKDIDIVHCGYEKRRLDGSSKMVIGTNQKYCFDRTEGMLHFIKGDLFTGALWNKMYRKEIINNLEFDETIKINEDVLFNFYAFKNARESVLIDRPLYHYYERENASTKRTDNQKKISDCTLVAKTIYLESTGKNYEVIARSKYIKQLMNLYRAYLFQSIHKTRSDRKRITSVLDELLCEKHGIKARYLYDFKVMVKMPRLYILLYTIYNKVRKPNWDV